MLTLQYVLPGLYLRRTLVRQQFYAAKKIIERPLPDR